MSSLRTGSCPCASLVVLICGLIAAPAVSAGNAGSCAEPGDDPRIVLETGRGDIVVALAPEAAPETVAWVLRLVRGPVFHPEVDEEDRGPGFYDGLAFDYTRPGMEVRTAQRPPAGTFTHPMEIDAGALGLDEDRVGDAGAAMDVWQFELYPHFTYRQHRGGVTQRLHGWVRQWRESGEADFLVGESRKAINEALGYRYTSGLSSLAPESGTVVLHPEAPGRSGARLRFLLEDRPQLAGRATVIGRVAKGTAVVERIARSTLVPPPYVDKNAFQPARPVQIENARVDCASGED